MNDVQTKAQNNSGHLYHGKIDKHHIEPSIINKRSVAELKSSSEAKKNSKSDALFSGE